MRVKCINDSYYEDAQNSLNYPMISKGKFYDVVRMYRKIGVAKEMTDRWGSACYIQIRNDCGQIRIYKKDRFRLVDEHHFCKYEDKITANNKIIAEFTDGVFSNKFNGWFLWIFDGVSTLYPELKFHKSWDWLMPVVDLIESRSDNRYKVWIYPPYAMVKNDKCAAMIEEWRKTKPYMANNESVYKTTESVSDTRIDAVYNVVIDFIKWYNKRI